MKTILRTLGNITSTVTGIAGVIGIFISVTWGVYKFIDNNNKDIASNKEIQKTLSEIKQEMTELKQTNADGHTRIVKSIAETQDQINDIRGDNAKWNNSYLKYIKDNAKNSEQLYKYIEGLNLEEAKKKISYSPTQHVNTLK